MTRKKVRRGARLGQHFLNAPWVARELVGSLRIEPSETILEIGPGKGALTRELLATGNPVFAIEKDELLVDELQDTFSEEIRSKQLTVIAGDIRDFDPSASLPQRYVIAANIPYYITGEIIRRFLGAARQPRGMSLLMQKEVAQRIVATDKQSILSLSVRAYGTPSIVKIVPASCFNPPPRVDSAILLIDAISRDFFTDVSEESFFTTVRAGFASKRKRLANNLAHLLGQDALQACSIAENARAEDVPLGEWRCLAK